MVPSTALLLLVAMIASELPTLKPPAKGDGVRDGGSARLLAVCWGLTIAAAFASRALHLGPGPGPWAAVAGSALTLIGISVRLCAMRALGPLFTRTIQTRPGQPLVTHGPYRLIRHPSYTGYLLGLFGIGLALQSWVALALCTLPNLAAVLYRIHVEEKALLDALGAPYRRYRSATRKLIPFVL